MEARIKKLFHRKKDSSAETHLQHTQKSDAARSSPALRTSLYDTVPTRGPPQTGSYPIKGDNTSVTLQKRKSSQRNRGPSDPIPSPFDSSSSSQPRNGSKPMPTGLSPTQNDFLPDVDKINQPYLGRRSEGDSGVQRKPNDVTLSNEFSALSLDHNQSISRLNKPPTSQHDSTPSLDQSHREGLQNSEVSTDPVKSEPVSGTNVPALSIRKGAASGSSENRKGHRKDQSSYSSAAIYSPRSDSLNNEADIPGENAIQRKQVPMHFEGQENTNQRSPVARKTKSNGNLGSPHPLSDRFDEVRQFEMEEKDKTEPILRDIQAKQAENIISRAHNDSVDTEVAEAWAPAIVHETVHQDIHHVRKELVTREVHNHEIYHRILPIIDVEVLPPRHFLPVEGGGLVEISSDEVPGRGRNWVIAETASKIPSDQAAPRGVNRFSAREFFGEEGDSKAYITPEGIRTTEETWVHPPELEIGGRDTGQTWPMVFGDDIEQKEPQLLKSSKIGKKESTRRSSTSHSTPAGKRR